MYNYKERMIKAKEIFDKNNPVTKQYIIKRQKASQKLKKEIIEKRERAKKLATRYFSSNEAKLITETLDYFIVCLENEKGKNIFCTQYDMEYISYPDELRGHYEEDFMFEIVRLIRERLTSMSPDFCKYEIIYKSILDKRYDIKNARNKKFSINITLYINN